MSLTEVRIKGTKIRVPLGSLVHQLLLQSNSKSKQIENQGDAPIYNMLQIAQPTTQWLGKGSTGTVYHASFVLPKHSIDCVVKFPNTLLSNECILINEKDGTITLNPKKKDEAKEVRRQALEELETEWHNAFLLHFGKSMLDTHIAEPYHTSISTESVLKAAKEMVGLQHKWGYNHIHQLLAIDASVPCLISEHFEMALLEWARQTKPSRADVNEKVSPQMLAALHYMHSHAQLAHMDIKPNNMLYSPNKGIVLSDFGASMPVDAQSHESVGTVGYQAPEVALGAYVPRFADAYSFAVAMLHLIHPEIACETTKDQKSMFKKIQDLENKDASVQPPWNDIIACKVPSERYPLLLEAMSNQKKGLWIQQQAA